MNEKEIIDTESKIEQTEQNVEQKPYTLRALAAKDVFPMVKIISKIGINEFTKAFESDEIKQIVAAFTGDEKGQDDKLTIVGISVALDIANVILSHIGTCENEVYNFLSGLSGISKKDVAELPMNTFLEMIVDVFKKDEFKGFIGVVSKLVK